MGYWPLYPNAHKAPVLGYETGLQSGGSSHTKGSFTSIGTTPAYPVDGLMIAYHVHTGRGLMDISLDNTTSGIIAENLPGAGTSWNDHSRRNIEVPVPIPASTTLYARTQNNGASSWSYVGWSALGMPKAGCEYGRGAEIITIGANLASTAGIEVDPGGVASTWGSWVEIEDSTTSDLKALYVFVLDDSMPADVAWYFQLGVGGSGSEKEVTPPLFGRGGGTANWVQAHYGPLPVSIPAGTRISAKAKTSNTTVGTRELFLVVLGLV